MALGSRTSIGGLLLQPVEGWTFSTTADGGVAGIHDWDPGILRIKSIPPDRLPQPVTHDDCLRLASELAGVAQDAELQERTVKQSVTGPYGGAKYHRGKDLVCVWYCYRPAGLVFGTYGCPLELSHSADNRTIRTQCAQMILSAVFDRPAWGADDEMTRVMIAALAEGEPKRHNAPAPPPPPAAAQPGTRDPRAKPPAPEGMKGKSPPRK
jgi:hypothetical protein